MNIKEIDSIVKNGINYYNYVECCNALDLSPASMRYCLPKDRLIVEDGTEWVTEDGLWQNLYRQSKQYYRDQQTLKMINSTTPLF